jgi:hypothetical protein
MAFLTLDTYKSQYAFSPDSRHREDRLKEDSTRKSETNAEQSAIQPIKSQDKANPPSLLRSAGMHGMIVAAGSAADFILTGHLSKNLSSLGFCLGSFVPKGSRSWCKYIGNSLGRLNGDISRIFGENLSSKVMIPAACEEIEFRWFAQEVLLRKLPKAVLQKIAPHLTGMVDSLPARISRIAAAALFFALCHTYVLDCAAGGGIAQLVGGLLYGAIFEYTGSLPTCISMHFLYNLFINILA